MALDHRLGHNGALTIQATGAVVSEVDRMAGKEYEWAG